MNANGAYSNGHLLVGVVLEHQGLQSAHHLDLLEVTTQCLNCPVFFLFARISYFSTLFGKSLPLSDADLDC